MVEKKPNGTRPYFQSKTWNTLVLHQLCWTWLQKYVLRKRVSSILLASKGRIVESKGVKSSIAGVPLSSQCIVAPFPRSFLLNLHKDFLPSYESDITFLQCVVNPELSKNSNTELSATPKVKRALTHVLLCRNEFRAKLRQSLSDELSPRKQNTRNMLFSLLRHYCLLSSYVAHFEQQKTSRAVEMLKAKHMFLRTGISDE